MTALALPFPVPARRLFAPAAAVVAALAGSALLWPGGDGGPKSGTVATASERFELNYPQGWKAATPDELRAAAGRPDALLLRPDGRGVLSVHERPRLDGSLADVGRGLDRRLGKSMPGAERVAGRVVSLETGAALSYTFTRPGAGLVQNIVVAPAGARTLVVETAARADAPDVAAEVGAIVRSLRRAS